MLTLTNTCQRLVVVNISHRRAAEHHTRNVRKDGGDAKKKKKIANAGTPKHLVAGAAATTGQVAVTGTTSYVESSAPLGPPGDHLLNQLANVSFFSTPSRRSVAKTGEASSTTQPCRTKL